MDESRIEFVRIRTESCHLFDSLSATFVINCKLGDGLPLILTGSRIQSRSVIHVDGVPVEFWMMRDALPTGVGWNIFLIDKRRVIGISRSTHVRVETDR